MQYENAPDYPQMPAFARDEGYVSSIPPIPDDEKAAYLLKSISTVRRGAFELTHSMKRKLVLVSLIVLIGYRRIQIYLLISYERVALMMMKSLVSLQAISQMVLQVRSCMKSSRKIYTLVEYNVLRRILV